MDSVRSQFIAPDCALICEPTPTAKQYFGRVLVMFQFAEWTEGNSHWRLHQLPGVDEAGLIRWLIGLVKRYLWLSQLSLFSLLAVCSVTLPSVMEKNGGVSNFGENASTVVPYVLSFSFCILFLCLATRQLLAIGNGLRIKAALIAFISLLDLLVLVSTFLRKLGWTYSVIHDDLGIALYGYEFVLSVWLAMRQRSLRSTLLLTIETLGSVVGLLSAVKVIHLLYVGQIIGAIAFGLLLVTTFPAVAEPDRVVNKK